LENVTGKWWDIELNKNILHDDNIMFGLFKRKDITIVNKNELISTMTRIVEILRDNAFSAQADAVRKPLQYLYSDDKDNFVKHLLTVDIWGGSGAAWEVAPFPSRQIEKEFEKHFVKLVDLMRQCGIKNVKATSVEKYFKKDLGQRD
jgi:hypothetical protein